MVISRSGVTDFDLITSREVLFRGELGQLECCESLKLLACWLLVQRLDNAKG